MQGPTLHDVLNNSYAKKDKQKVAFEKEGYAYDNDLSNHNQQVYHNKTNGKTMLSIAGTHNLKDVGTDLWLGLGGLKKTDRYKEAKRVADKAREKYKPADGNFNIAGHSLGGSIAQYIGSKSKKDNVVTLNHGATIGMKSKKHIKQYRTGADVVSLLNAGGKHIKTVDSKFVNPLKAHSYAQIKSNKKVRFF